MNVTLIKPQGFCSGVLKAVKTAYDAKEKHPDKNIYILGMLAHNQSLINDLTKNGFVTINDENEEDEIRRLQKGDVLIFTAHGHDSKLDELANELGIITYDATCFKVKSNLERIRQEVKDGHQVIYIGQKGHKEANAALSISDNVSLYDTKLLFNYYFITDKHPYVINQTTLNFYELENYHKDILAHFPGARIENEICAATRLRQEAVTKIDKDTDLIVVVGHHKSSNSNKLFDIASSNFKNSKVLMVNDLDELKGLNLEGKKKAAVVSGASTPKYIVDEIYDYLLSK